MKKIFSLIFICLVISSNSQVDSSFVIVREGVAANFPFRKFNTAEQMKNTKGLEFPQYSFNDKQYKRISGLMKNFVENEVDLNKRIKLSNSKDSIYEAQIKIYKQNDSLQSLRASNFENSYNKALELNKQYNEQLATCTQTAKKEARKSKLTTLIYGAAGGLLVGFAAGFVLK